MFLRIIPYTWGFLLPEGFGIASIPYFPKNDEHLKISKVFQIAMSVLLFAKCPPRTIWKGPKKSGGVVLIFCSHGSRLHS